MNLLKLRADTKDEKKSLSKNIKTEEPQQMINETTEVNIIPEIKTVSTEETNVEKIRLLEKPLIAVELRSIQENVSSKGDVPVRKKGDKKRNSNNDFKISQITEKQFNSFETFIPNKGNISGNQVNYTSSVHLTEENEKFIALMVFRHGSRKNAVVNHMMDIVRTYFKDDLK